MTKPIDHLQALLAKGLTQEEETIARRYYSQKERDSMDESDFAGPHQSYPIKTQQDVMNAARLIGHADDPDAVKAAIKRIAKRKGFKLPESWEEEDKKDDSTERAADGTIQASDRHTMSLPLVRIDPAKREVWGQATAEVPDSYGTIFGYCPDAWTKWRGNIREQHDPKKAVGKAVEINPDAQERAIYVGSRVSRGAQDTWLKVEDNVLTGYSASIIPDAEYGPDPRKWPKKEYNGKEYPYLPRYTVAELSLVDNPACPGCNIQIVRADGFVTDVLDCTEEETPPIESVVSSSLARAGARVSSSTRDAMHDSIGHTLKAAHSQMQNCGCEDCAAAMKMLDPDNDGDIDLGGYLDPDNDADSLYGGSDGDMERNITGIIERILDAKLSAVYARLQGIAGTLARSNAAPTSLDTLITGVIERTVEAVQTANASSWSEVRAELSAVKETVERIDATPLPGAPIQNTSALPRPANKHLATDPAPAAPRGALYDAMATQFARNAQSGAYRSLDEQIQDMAAVLAVQPPMSRR